MTKNKAVKPVFSLAFIPLFLLMSACSGGGFSESSKKNEKFSQTIENISPYGNTIPDRAMF
ncbi:hypothetical protein [Gluconobacter cerinus]|uniref:Uncharacterized protein n=1 Tax=Gluconobacter cerinus TaxID=38307 RepID=A0A1B6VLQ8_9PROT|nr:hypothetical protein [Gluconobacter cerinus]OAJ68153.1 hypothetical protein A0123_00856 [Gluconobacter cerinus]